jgi:Zn/Cd-binding protein ZinT
MPYKVQGKNLMHFKQGRWTVKQVCKSHDNAIGAMKLLQMKEHGVPTKK